MRQTLIATVENKPGVLNRVASLFRRRNFNIDSLNVGRTENPDISRMTIVMDSSDVSAERVEANLYKLVNVVDVQDVTDMNAVLRELALVKIRAGAEKAAEVKSVAAIVNGTIADVGKESMIVQIVAPSEEVDSLLDILAPYGIIESVRTGNVAMTRGVEGGKRHTPNAESASLNGVG